MKSWENLEADENLILATHMTKGRQGCKIDKIVVHHNGGNLTGKGCYDVWQTREASAHYQVAADGRITQLVWDTDTAWHSGDWNANLTSIGVEHADISADPWMLSEATLDNGAHLVAALCKHYGLGRPQWRVNVFPHSDFTSTACPASIAGSQNAAYMAKAQAYYDSMTGSHPATESSPTTTDAGGVNVVAGAYVVACDSLNVRSAPSTGATVVASYGRGQTVTLDHWGTVADGYIWGRYTAYSGAVRYIALAPADKSTWYLVKA